MHTPGLLALILGRTTITAIMLSFLISLVVFIIIDLDRPKKGIIKIIQQSMLLLKND